MMYLCAFVVLMHCGSACGNTCPKDNQHFSRQVRERLNGVIVRGGQHYPGSSKSLWVHHVQAKKKKRIINYLDSLAWLCK